MEALKKFWSWLYDIVLNKPFSGWISVIAIIIYFFGWLQPKQTEIEKKKYQDGFEASEKNNLRESKKDSITIAELKLENKNLEILRDTTDCGKELQKSMNMFLSLKSQIVQNNNDKLENLQTLKKTSGNIEKKINQYSN